MKHSTHADLNILHALAVLTQQSEKCTAEADVTYPHPQQKAQRDAHLDWHRGYRGALRDVKRLVEEQRSDAQDLDLYGVRVTLRQTRLYEIEVTFMGGTHPDGAEMKSFPNMAAALAYVADIAADLEAEEGDDWGVDDE